MLHRFFQSSFWTQAVLLALFAFALHVIVQSIGINIVLYNYYLGGHSFLKGLNPYEVTLQNGASNQFKYSPLFAVIAGGMARASDPLNSIGAIRIAGLWVLASTLMFSIGLGRWCDMSRRAPFYIIIALAAAITDLYLSTGVYQANAICIGLLLLGLAEYRDGRHLASGALLLLASNFKIYPAIFFIALLLQFKWRYWLGALCAGLLAFIIPAFFAGWTHNFNMHLAWVNLVFHDTGTYRILDMVSAFERVGMPILGTVLGKTVLIISAFVFFAYIIATKKPDWRPWITLGISSILLLSPKTEVFTYVLLAPSYVFMFHWCMESDAPFLKKYGPAMVTLLAAVAASCRFIDPNWGHSENAIEIVRVLGALGFWVFTGAVLALALYKNIKERRSTAPRRGNAA